jgi:hypothetical protein
VTSTPAPNDPTHASPQLIPGMSLATEPPAVPTASWYTVSGGANVAVTERGLFMVTMHVPVPVQAPDQPEKDQPGIGLAVRVTSLSARSRSRLGCSRSDPVRSRRP